MIIYNELKMGGGESIFEISEFGEEEKRGKYLLFSSPSSPTLTR